MKYPAQMIQGLYGLFFSSYLTEVLTIMLLSISGVTESPIPSSFPSYAADTVHSAGVCSG